MDGLLVSGWLVDQRISSSGSLYDWFHFKCMKKKPIDLKSCLECSDRSGNVRNRFLVKFYQGAILRFFSQLSFFIEKIDVQTVSLEKTGFH